MGPWLPGWEEAELSRLPWLKPRSTFGTHVSEVRCQAKCPGTVSGTSGGKDSVKALPSGEGVKVRHWTDLG